MLETEQMEQANAFAQAFPHSTMHLLDSNESSEVVRTSRTNYRLSILRNLVHHLYHHPYKAIPITEEQKKILLNQELKEGWDAATKKTLRDSVCTTHHMDLDQPHGIDTWYSCHIIAETVNRIHGTKFKSYQVQMQIYRAKVLDSEDYLRVKVLPCDWDYVEIKHLKDKKKSENQLLDHKALDRELRKMSSAREWIYTEKEIRLCEEYLDWGPPWSVSEEWTEAQMDELKWACIGHHTLSDIVMDTRDRLNPPERRVHGEEINHIYWSSVYDAVEALGEVWMPHISKSRR